MFSAEFAYLIKYKSIEFVNFEAPAQMSKRETKKIAIYIIKYVKQQDALWIQIICIHQHRMYRATHKKKPTPINKLLQIDL